MNGRDEPIRVLQVVGRMDRGGIETMIMNLYRNIDRSKVQFDFLCHFGREAAYNDEIRAMGGRIYEMPALRDEHNVFFWRFFLYLWALNKFFREHREYKIVHGHMTHTAALYLPVAKKYGVTCRIVHSHSTHSKSGLLGILTDFLHKFATIDATHFFACTEATKKWFFSDEIINSGEIYLLANAIDAKRFRFDPDTRFRMRREFGIEENVVVGCVGRFRQEKNQGFMLDVLKSMLEIEPNTMLLFAGDGPYEEKVKNKANEQGLQEHIIFLGMRSDVQDVMQAMDVFVLPSLWEGMPLVGIEAQASGLHCVVSDGVSKELDVLEMVDWLPLSAGSKAWAEALLCAANSERRDTYEQLCSAGYDIGTTAPWLQKFYLNHSK